MLFVHHSCEETRKTPKGSERSEKVLLASSFGVQIEAMVLFKVGVSCYAAVLSDAKLKGFSNMSMSAKLSLMSLSRVIASIAIAAVMEPGVQPSYHVSAAGFFDHWTLATWIVTLSFTSKSLITLYLLKSLDGIQKNVGEAVAFEWF